MDPPVLNDSGKRTREAEHADDDRLCVLFPENDLKGLTDFRDSFSESEIQEFRKEFRRIDTVLDIEVDQPAIRSILKYFEPRLRCFVLPNVDVTPTIEEYHHVLRPSWNEGHVKMYVPDLSKPVPKPGLLKNFLQQHFGIPHSWSKSALLNFDGSTVIRWDRLYHAMKEDPAPKWGMQHRFRFLALGIYELVLFPSHNNEVDYRVLDLLMKVTEGSDINIMFTVLAETLRACEFIKRKKGGTMKCCTQILTMWIHEHFSDQDGPSYRKANYFTNSLPMREFGKSTKKNLSMEAWYKVLYDAEPGKIRWRVRWMNTTDQYLKPPCGQNWILLVVVFGAISYSPNMVVQQFGDEQMINSYFTVYYIILIELIMIDL